MMLWALRDVRHALYAPLELLADCGIVAPLWYIEAVLALDRQLLRAMDTLRGDGGAAPM